MPSCETLYRLVSLTGRMGKMSGGGTICTGSEGVWQVERELPSDLEGEAQTLLCPLPQTYPFLPTVVDGVVLPKMPVEMLAEKNFNTVPYIVGINKQEFGWILPLVRKNRLISHARHITLPSVVTDLSLGPGQLSPSYKLTFPWKPSLMVHTVIWVVSSGDSRLHTLSSCPLIHES